MTEPTLRDMYRWSGSSQPSTTQDTSPQQPETTASQSLPSRPTAAARQASGDSVDSEDAGYWYLSGSQYPTPYSESESTQPFFSSSQPTSTSRPAATARQHSGEMRRPTRPRADDTRQQLGVASQPPATSRSSEERPRYSSAPQPPAVSRPYDDRPRYTSAPEASTLSQTSRHSRQPSSDRTGYGSIPDAPQSATGSFQRADRPSNGMQPSSQQPTTTYASRPSDDRYRYSMRTVDDRQRYSGASQATTIAPPGSARVSEDKQRYSGGAPTATTINTHDFARSTAPTSGTAATTQPATAPARPSVTMNIPQTSPAPGDGTDERPTVSENAASSTSPDDPMKAKVTIEVFRALLGIPQGSTPLPLSNLRQAADRIAEGQTPLTASTATPIHPIARASTGKSSSIAPPFKVRSRGPSWLPRWLRRKPDDSEYDTSVYYSIIGEQKTTQRQYVLYDLLVYVCLLLQLIIAAVLIILGAINMNFHIPIAVLGAITGIITGMLSLIRGQGLPNRLMQYADGLRKVRDDIEFTERELMAGMRAVTYHECVDLRNAYENIREDATKNHPDTWTAWTQQSGDNSESGGASAANAGTAKTPSTMEKGKPF